MDDLFNQLKSEGPLKNSNTLLIKSSSSNVESSEEININHKCKPSGTRRESLSSPITLSAVLNKSSSQKARSLSPPKHSGNSVVKSLKVKLERKKFEEFLTSPLEEHANNIRKKQEKFKDVSMNPKMTPTKAQQKLFEPLLGENKTKDQILKEFNIKPCRVRIHRDNLHKLLIDYKNKNAGKKDGKFKTNKRLAPATPDSPPLKKGKLSTVDNKHIKSKNNFFVKLNTSPQSKMEKKLKGMSRTSPSYEAHHNKIRNSKFDTITTPTKFSRSQLFRSFGKRFFNVQVKIERCTHPLMLTFESNDRARRLQIKRNKSKNLSVSFREQVEIFGGCSDSDDSCDENFSTIPTNRNSRKCNDSQPVPAPLNPVVMPARLKKVENGKVVDDIELDPSLFVDPKIFVSSTPYSPGRKKRDHKSFSPLKDESSPSPRKEQLKLANERIPPSGLRRLNIDEEDDEDDECEYIVPIELPQRRTSRTSSNTTIDDLTTESIPPAVSPINIPDICDDGTADKVNCIENADDLETNTCTKNNTEKSTVLNLENGSDESFQSAKDDMDNNNEANGDSNQFQSPRISPTYELQLEEGKSNCGEFGQAEKQENGNACNESDISMNSLLEDSQTHENDTQAKSFVDTIINETIDKLTKDLDESATEKHYNSTT